MAPVVRDNVWEDLYRGVYVDVLPTPTLEGDAFIGCTVEVERAP